MTRFGWVCSSHFRDCAAGWGARNDGVEGAARGDGIERTTRDDGPASSLGGRGARGRRLRPVVAGFRLLPPHPDRVLLLRPGELHVARRSEERRGGKECVIPVRPRV